MWVSAPAAEHVADTAPAITTVACAPASARERCGYITVPLDRRHPNGRQIRIHFELHLRKDTSLPATSTVVSIEGGPGFPTIADRANRMEVWKPVSERRDLLLVDLRGTGLSGALKCDAFKNHSTNYPARAGLCARQLGPSRDFYSTSQAVQDIQAVLTALHAGKIDLYGDSYGSYSAQAFALRYPHRLRSLTLDGTYQLPGSDPLFSDLAQASRSAIRLACKRGPNCPVKGADPVAFVERFVDRIRTHPITGATHDADGNPIQATVDEDALVQTVMFGEGNPGVWRDLLGAIASANHGDNAPILRLIAENITYDGGNGPAGDFSEALYLSVICHDYPQPWSFSTPMGDRQAAFDAALAARPASQFAPFSPEAWTGTDYEGALACLDWPSPAFDDPPVPPHAVYPHVPTLILNGDLDNITPIADARVVASRFPDSTLVDVFNTVHVTALGDRNGCASVIYERFVRTLSPGDTSCASRVPEVRVVGRYPLNLGDVAPATAKAGDQSTLRERRMAAAAAATIADAIQDWEVNYSGVGVPLHGGKWTYSGDLHTVFQFTKAKLVPGVAVSGRTGWDYRTGPVTADVTVTVGTKSVKLHMTWSLNQRLGKAAITGTAGGRHLRLTMLAP